MEQIAFDTFAIEVPHGWADITHAVEAEGTPYTIARADGVGALQFSVAIYKTGSVPNPTPAVLLEMIKDFGRKKGLGSPSTVIAELGSPILAAGSFSWDADFLRVWQLSDGYNFAFVTYTCAAEDVGPELAACEQIVRSLKFREMSQGE